MLREYSGTMSNHTSSNRIGVMDTEKYRPREMFDSTTPTTNSGAPVDDTMNSLTVSERGPVLLSDFHLVEKLANFDRERIPERVVHARGVTARGEFVCTNPISQFTIAEPFSTQGKITPVAVRFSTVVHSRHSPETLRDPRGFATKFYTQKGNFDLVGNNFPVFFIRDAMAFPDMVHAFKPSPVTEQQEWHRVLDFLSFHPESLHMLTFLLDDVGVPKNYTTMNGAGVHTFVLINEAGKETYVKFHWISEQGEHSLEEDAEIARVQGENFSHATTHLIESISAGQFPSWRLCVQTMDVADELTQQFGDPLDPTKTWPESQFPLREVGRLTLNRNLDNHYLEGEQIAFSPGNIIPGIQYSADKLLQGRIFSYADTQRYRIGANYLQLPINAAKCPFMNRQYDGAMNFMHRSSEVNYFPSAEHVRKSGGSGIGTSKGVKEMPITGFPVRGTAVRKSISHENNFQQAGERWRSFDENRRQRFVKRVAGTLNEPRVSKQLKAKWIGYWKQCDRDLGSRIERLVSTSML